VGEKKLTAKNCEKQIRKQLMESLEEILTGFVAAAKKGGCGHMRFVLELLARPVEKKRGPAEALLSELRKQRLKAERDAVG
jgi:hypothetical protein